MATILLVDDNSSMRRMIRQSMESDNRIILEAEDGEEAWGIIKKENVNVVVSGIKMYPVDGLSLLKMIRDQGFKMPVIILTAYGTIENAVEAMKLGAFDFITKPFSTEQIKLLIEKALKEQKPDYINKMFQAEQSAEGVIGLSKEMQELYEQVNKIAPTNANVLIFGESGSGKEILARKVYLNSLRQNKPLIKLNCADLAESNLDNKFHKYEKGRAISLAEYILARFKLANGGTIFLDEIGDLGQPAQVKLLRLIEGQEYVSTADQDQVVVDARVISTTNKNIEEAIKKGQFRDDLFYRLNIVSVRVPPLRERKEDIEILAKHFLLKYGWESKEKIGKIDRQALNLLEQYYWPGNIRELESTIRRAVISSESDTIYPSDLPIEIRDYKKTKDLILFDETSISLTERLEKYEKELIIKAMEKTNHVQTKAAILLNINRTALIYKLKKYGFISASDAGVDAVGDDSKEQNGHLNT